MKKQISKKIEFKNWKDFSSPCAKSVLATLDKALKDYAEATVGKSELAEKITHGVYESFEVTKRDPKNHHYITQEITELSKDEFLNMLENYDAGRVYLSAQRANSILIDFLPCIKIVAISISGDPIFVHKILTLEPELIKSNNDSGESAEKGEGKGHESDIKSYKERFSSFFRHPIVAPIIVLLILSILAVLGFYNPHTQTFDFKHFLPQWAR